MKAALGHRHNYPYRALDNRSNTKSYLVSQMITPYGDALRFSLWKRAAAVVIG